MADAIALEIVTPDGLKLKEMVSELTAPSVDGEFGVLPMHRPLLAALATGLVTYVREGRSHSVAVGPGFVEVAADRALLLTDRFVTKEAVDAVRVRLDLKAVDEKLDHYKGDPQSPEYAELVEQECWAAAQLELHGDPPPPRVRTTSGLAIPADYTKVDAGEGEASDHAADAPPPQH
jgi:F-type H+-transporting ATPase subunit epsilon